MMSKSYELENKDLKRGTIDYLFSTKVNNKTRPETFSKMKLIKTTARNSMSDTRLSGLSLLAIERDVIVDYEDIIDEFANHHKNSRLLLK